MQALFSIGIALSPYASQSLAEKASQDGYAIDFSDTKARAASMT
jgi:hypothetical protein